MTITVLWVVLHILATFVGFTGTSAQVANKARKEVLDEVLPVIERDLRKDEVDEFKDMKSMLRKQTIKNGWIFALIWWLGVVGYAVTLYLIIYS